MYDLSVFLSVARIRLRYLRYIVRRDSLESVAQIIVCGPVIADKCECKYRLLILDLVIDILRD